MSLTVGHMSHSGKTTLMKALLKTIPTYPGVIAEVPPEITLNNAPCETTHEAADIPRELTDKVRGLAKFNSDNP